MENEVIPPLTIPLGTVIKAYAPVIKMLPKIILKIEFIKYLLTYYIRKKHANFDGNILF